MPWSDQLIRKCTPLKKQAETASGLSDSQKLCPDKWNDFRDGGPHSSNTGQTDGQNRPAISGAANGIIRLSGEALHN